MQQQKHCPASTPSGGPRQGSGPGQEGQGRTEGRGGGSKCIFKCLASSRICPFCRNRPPLSALALGPCVSQFQLAALAPGILQLRVREGGRGPASSPLPRAWRWAYLCKFSPIHTVSAHSLRHQAYSLAIKLMVTILEGNPGHCRGKVIERKILGSGLR